MCGVRIVLSARQRDLLCHVVEAYVATGQPVGSKTLVEKTEVGVSPSTVRSELAELERLGLLTHPHTSAGRLPTEGGYRLYVDELLARPQPRPGDLGIGLPAAHAEVEDLPPSVRDTERIMLGLRLDEPLPLAGLEAALDAVQLERLEGLGLAVREAGSLTLTPRGRFLGGGVTARLLA